MVWHRSTEYYSTWKSAHAPQRGLIYSVLTNSTALGPASGIALVVPRRRNLLLWTEYICMPDIAFGGGTCSGGGGGGDTRTLIQLPL